MPLKESVPTSPANEYYEIRQIPGKGYGCFALKPIKRGTRILADSPLLIVPVANYLKADVQAAFDKLSQEERDLYFSLHSGHGQDRKVWPSEPHPMLEDKERQRTQEQHEARMGTEPTLISIFQTNCMEMNRGAAVFPHAARFNHCCNPNACFTWNAAIGKETIHIMNDVNAGDEITLSYCDMIHDKSSRAWELKHYGFVCDCPACAGNGNDVDTFAYKSAQRRFLLHELDLETRFFRGARLEQGATQDDFVRRLLDMAVLHQQEGDFTARLACVFLDIALICELKGDLTGAYAAATRAAQIKRNCQGEDFPDYKKYAEVVQRIRGKLGQQA